MDKIWEELYNAARAVQDGRRISEYVEAGGVAAAVLSDSGKIYTGVCVDTACTLGICAEDYRNIEIMMDYSAGKIKTLGELTPEWWI